MWVTEDWAVIVINPSNLMQLIVLIFGGSIVVTTQSSVNLLLPTLRLISEARVISLIQGALLEPMQ